MQRRGTVASEVAPVVVAANASNGLAMQRDEMELEQIAMGTAALPAGPLAPFPASSMPWLPRFSSGFVQPQKAPTCTERQDHNR